MYIRKESKYYKYLFFSLWLVAFLVVFLWGEAILPEKYFRDSELIMEMASGSASPSSQDGSYYYTTLVFEFLGEHLSSLLVFVTGIAYIATMSFFVRRWDELAYGSVLLMPHLVLGLSRPQKETLVSILVIACFFVYRKSKNLSYTLLLIFALYLSYGLVRNYYLLIIAVFALLLLMERLNFEYKALVVLLVLFSLFLLPEDFFFKVQGTRDIFNSLRPMGGAGHETIYFNPLTPDSAQAFMGNYFSSLVYFNFPIFFVFTGNSLYLQIYILILLVSFFKFSQIESIELRLFGLLFISHLLVLLLFEPDLGSYMRHLSSVSIYIMMYFSWMKYERTN
ncbi:hypothetical protein [Agarivorans sp. Z349TD_8]|uniref:hypothetical protein n=1 Tax=Agarivorans sp. Z349TD_8 TaxID=3421434 RepID=UPI003D7DD781